MAPARRRWPVNFTTQRDVSGRLALDWLTAPDSGEIDEQAELDRVACADHS